MVRYDIKCLRCGEKLQAKAWAWRHNKDNGTLSVTYRGLEKYELSELLLKEYMDIRRYVNVLPVSLKYLNIVPIGFTPIINRKFKGVSVFFKLEYLLPSGSFKDRGALVSIAKAKELRIKKIIEDSSGNAGAAFSLYSLLYNIEANIFIPTDAPLGKKALLRSLKARLHEIQGSREEVNRAAIDFESHNGGAYVGHWWNPFFIEGVKTLAYEIHEQLGMDKVDSIIVPTSSGGLLLGIFKGIMELKTMGEISKVPKLIAVQASGYARLCYELGYGMGSEKSKLANGLRIVEPPRIGEMVLAVRETKGTCYHVTDEEVAEGLKKLWGMGFLVEPTSAVVYAALKKAISEKVVEKGENTVVILTGSGAKMLDKVLSIIET